MTSSYRNIFQVTGPSWGEFTDHRWIPLTKDSDVELRCFYLSHICIGKLNHHWFRKWLVACLAPRQYLNWCWVNFTLDPREQTSVKFQTKWLHFRSRKCIWKNLCEILEILARPHCVNTLGLQWCDHLVNKEQTKFWHMHSKKRNGVIFSSVVTIFVQGVVKQSFSGLFKHAGFLSTG